MLALTTTTALFVLTALAEIVGCYLPWLVLRQGKPFWLLLPAALRGGQATAVQVLDALGRVMLTRTLAVGPAETLTLPLGALAPGLYLVQAHTAVGLVTKQLAVR